MFLFLLVFLNIRIEKIPIFYTLNHSLNKFINLIFTVTKITAFNIMIVLLVPATSWSVQFEGPQEVVYLFEDATCSVDLIHHIFNALNVVSIFQFTFNTEVVCNWNTSASVLQLEKKEN